MSLSNQHQLNGFNRLAPFYDLLSYLVFGGAIQRAQLHGLTFLKGDEHVWMIGGGTGWALSQYLKKHPQLTITYIEASSKMIELAQKKLTPQQEQRVRWIHSTHEWIYQNPQEVNACDGLITFFFLDVLNPKELELFFDWVDQHQGPKTKTNRPWIWLFADFCPHPSPWKMHFVSFMYWCFRWATGLKNKTLSPYPKMFSKRGWTLLTQNDLKKRTQLQPKKNSSLSQQNSSYVLKTKKLIQSRVYYRA